MNNEILNETISSLYGTLEAKDKIINNQALEIARLKKEKDTLYNALITTRTKYNNDKARYRRKAKRYKQKINKAIEYNQKIYDTTENQTKLMAKINLEILGDKENE